jgi:hypothetical protein
LLGLPFNPEDGGDMFLQNIGLISTQISQLYIPEERTLQGTFSIRIPLSTILIGILSASFTIFRRMDGVFCGSAPRIYNKN